MSTEAKGVPRHLAVIMDGNGRWAQARGLPRSKGHEQGAESVREVVRACGDAGVEVLTLYSFSTENWKRPNGEIESLMGLLLRYLKDELAELNENGVRLMAIGEIDSLPIVVRTALKSVIKATARNNGLKLVLALSYGSRAEIVRTFQEIAKKVSVGKLAPKQIDEALISRSLDTGGLPDPDFVIRTSGELRLSNFLLWQIAYAELYITDVAWPDFRKPQLHQAFEVFRQRKRRFGKTGEQIEDRNES